MSTKRCTIITGSVNFRELGGYKGIDGRVIKKGHLFRSGELSNLTDADIGYLKHCQVTHIVDYRDELEKNAQPDKLWEGVQYHHCPMVSLAGKVDIANVNLLFNMILEGGNTQVLLQDFYQQLPFGQPAYRHLVQLLCQDESKGIIQHCAIGKDRTGFGTALVLLALGVSVDDVIEDYLLSNTFLRLYCQDKLKKIAHQYELTKEQLKQVQDLYCAKEVFIVTALDAIIQHYGTFDNWFEQELSLGLKQRNFLQDKYLVS